MGDNLESHRRPGIPSFLVIGAAKSGTYTLHGHLGSHSEVFVCGEKEPHFFAFGEQGLEFEAPHSPVFSWVDSKDKYAELFEAAGDALATGECSVSYLYWPGTAERIYRFNPKMKIIVSLRDPVDRAYSSFNYARSYGIEPLASLEEGLAAEPRRIRENRSILLRYRALGLYARQLQSYYDVFPGEQIKVLQFDDLVKNPVLTVRELFEFIGVNHNVEVKPGVRLNATRIPDDSNPLHLVLTSDNMARRAARHLLPIPARKRMRNLARNLLFKRPPRLDPGIRRRLLPLFRDDIQELEKVIDADLSQWMR